MIHCKLSSFILVLLFFTVTGLVLGTEPWTFVKERDGIRIYTRNEKNSSLKSFMGTMDVKTQMNKVASMIGNVKNTSWWDENVRELKVLDYEENKSMRYYLVYHAPWPVTDRDLCVEAHITNDSVTGRRIIYAVPLPGVIPDRPDKVRIRNYWQRWTIQPMPNGIVHLVLEGYVDPGGNIPAWVYNMVITDTPLNILRGIQKRVASY